MRRASLNTFSNLSVMEFESASRRSSCLRLAPANGSTPTPRSNSPHSSSIFPSLTSGESIQSDSTATSVEASSLILTPVTTLGESDQTLCHDPSLLPALSHCDDTVSMVLPETCSAELLITQDTKDDNQAEKRKSINTGSAHMFSPSPPSSSSSTTTKLSNLPNSSFIFSKSNNDNELRSDPTVTMMVGLGLGYGSNNNSDYSTSIRAADQHSRDFDNDRPFANSSAYQTPASSSQHRHQLSLKMPLNTSFQDVETPTPTATITIPNSTSTTMVNEYGLKPNSHLMTTTSSPSLLSSSTSGSSAKGVPSSSASSSRSQNSRSPSPSPAPSISTRSSDETHDYAHPHHNDQRARDRLNVPLRPDTPFLDRDDEDEEHADDTNKNNNTKDGGVPAWYVEELEVERKITIQLQEPTTLSRYERKQGWLGFWNRGHILDVIDELRLLRSPKSS